MCLLFYFFAICVLIFCQQKESPTTVLVTDYFKNYGDLSESAVVKLIPIKLLIPNFYHQHICRLTEWLDGLNRNRLHEITIPALLICAKHDTMDPKAMQCMMVKKGRYLSCPNGSHLSIDDFRYL